MNSKFFILPFHAPTQSILVQHFPSSQNLIALFSEEDQKQKILNLADSIAPAHEWAFQSGTFTTSGAQLLWVQHPKLLLLEKFSKAFTGNVIHSTYSQIHNQLSQQPTIDPHLCSLLFLNPFNRISAKKFVFQLHTHFLFSSFKTNYFNDWYEDQHGRFENLGFEFIFTTEDDPSCTIHGQAYCTKEQIEDVMHALKDLAKHYKGRFWCTQTVDELQNIEDLCET